MTAVAPNDAKLNEILDEAAASLKAGDEVKILFDAQSRLLSGVGRNALPVTLFVDADGGLRYVYNDKALDEASIARLAGTHLEVGT